MTLKEKKKKRNFNNVEDVTYADLKCILGTFASSKHRIVGLQWRKTDWITMVTIRLRIPALVLNWILFNQCPVMCVCALLHFAAEKNFRDTIRQIVNAVRI